MEKRINNHGNIVVERRLTAVEQGGYREQQATEYA